jgi:hypothetical protein
MKNIHPTDSLHFANPSQVSLGGFQILVPQDYLGDNFQGNPIPARMGRRIAPQVMRRKDNI